MIEIPVYDSQGNKVSALSVDEKVLGGEVMPALLKQAYVRYHANQRQGTVATKNRGRVEGSTRKLYKQKHTGNARRGTIRTNIMRGGGRGHGKRPHSWRLDMPDKMRRLANRNALLCKAVDGEIKVVDKFGYDKPSTKQFAGLLSTLKIDRSVLVALADTRGFEARSAANLDHVTLTNVDHLNVFDLLNHRYLLVEKSALQSWIDRAVAQQSTGQAASKSEAR
ncbi:MAG: 50S ribosomal protein L4 [Planctomycetota bacterium]|nr:50S ribosomal protein L4 [Planctomycetota bacterium]